MYEISTFPDRLKEAQVAPIHKKNSVLEKGNYRPVSVLPAISKNFENAIEAQLESGYIEEKEKLFSSNSGWLFFISKILGWSPSTLI
jgi:hypothetical protein